MVTFNPTPVSVMDKIENKSPSEKLNHSTI